MLNRKPPAMATARDAGEPGPHHRPALAGHHVAAGQGDGVGDQQRQAPQARRPAPEQCPGTGPAAAGRTAPGSTAGSGPRRRPAPWRTPARAAAGRRCGSARRRAMVASTQNSAGTPSQRPGCSGRAPPHLDSPAGRLTGVGAGVAGLGGRRLRARTGVGAGAGGRLGRRRRRVAAAGARTPSGPAAWAPWRRGPRMRDVGILGGHRRQGCGSAAPSGRPAARSPGTAGSGRSRWRCRRRTAPRASGRPGP